MSVKLTNTARLALQFLSQCGGGFTSGAIARNSGYGSSRSEMAVFRIGPLKRLFDDGLVDLIDAEKPHVYVITDAGRAALQKHKEHPGNG